MSSFALSFLKLYLLNDLGEEDLLAWVFHQVIPRVHVNVGAKSEVPHLKLRLGFPQANIFLLLSTQLSSFTIVSSYFMVWRRGWDLNP